MSSTREETVRAELLRPRPVRAELVEVDALEAVRYWPRDLDAHTSPPGPRSRAPPRGVPDVPLDSR
jgi:hypothetical protein